MQSSNPVFARNANFNGQSGYAGFGNAPASQGSYTEPYAGPVSNERMTIDTVVQKTGVTLGVVIAVAAATWVLTGDIFTTNGTVNSDVTSRLYLLAMVGAFAGFALSLVNSFKKVVSPVLVLAYAAMQGLFVGAFSKVLEAQFGGGLVVGAVLGTVAAVAGTLTAYKVLNIKVTPKFRRFVVAAMFGFVAVALLNFVLSFFNADFGFNGFGTMGLISSVIGLVLGVFMLILDFDFVEQGIAVGLPERESWRAAFGLTVTIVWIYIEMLRILAILRGDD